MINSSQLFLRDMFINPMDFRSFVIKSLLLFCLGPEDKKTNRAESSRQLKYEILGS